MKPIKYITKGDKETIISSKSKTKKIIQNIKNRKEIGKTLTLYESKPHSNTPILNSKFFINLLNISIKAGTKNDKTTYNTISHI